MIATLNRALNDTEEPSPCIIAMAAQVPTPSLSIVVHTAGELFNTNGVRPQKGSRC